LRGIVFTLVGLNVLAAILVLRPLGGSAADLEQQLLIGRQQVKQRQLAIERMKTILAKAQKGRKQGDGFLEAYFLDRRTMSSTILTELGDTSKKAGLRPRDTAFTFEPIDGSDVFTMMAISANFEGSYSQLIEFINMLDRSKLFLIIEDLQATPTQSTGVLSIRMRINGFVREAEPRT
jgi:hypothetical protein